MKSGAPRDSRCLTITVRGRVRAAARRAGRIEPRRGQGLRAGTVPERRDPVVGHDIALRRSMLNLGAREAVEPRHASVYKHAIRPARRARPHIAASPAPLDIARQIYHFGTMPALLAELPNGQPVDRMVAWASDELESFTR